MGIYVKIEVVLNDDVPASSADHFQRVHGIVSDIDMAHLPAAGVEVGYHEIGGVYVQVTMERPDTMTGIWGTGRGGKVFIHPRQTTSSIVRTVLARFMAYFEHEVREAFLYKGKRIYGPHLDVEALVEVADRLESAP
jgi:hypothetical protein